jgi:hypothetical protein
VRDSHGAPDTETGRPRVRDTCYLTTRRRTPVTRVGVVVEGTGAFAGVRRSGPPRFVIISSNSLDRELLRRGLTQKALGELARVPEATISRARNGRAVRPRVFRALADALAATPVLPGADALLAGPPE